MLFISSGLNPAERTTPSEYSGPEGIHSRILRGQFVVVVSTTNPATISAEINRNRYFIAQISRSAR